MVRSNLALLVACAFASLMAAAPSAALPLLSHHGRWLTDPQGRVVVLHGVQIDKFMPTQPVEGYIDVSKSNVRFMGAQGFNVARVSMAYAGFEPQLGRFDGAYLDRFLKFDGQLGRAGVYDLIDMMQGEYSTVVGGGGFPVWMTDTSGEPNNHDPFPRGYLDNPAENAAWDNFWANHAASDGTGYQDHYASGMHRISAAFAHAPGLLGLEILNEPWAGSRWPTCSSPSGCPPDGFDQTALTGLYRRVIPAIRSADRRHLIVYEPNLLFDFGAATGLAALGDNGLVFAFHNYCLGEMPGEPPLPDPFGSCGLDENMVFANADARSTSTGDGLLMDEWSNNTDPALVHRLAGEADQHLVGWTVWAYEDCCNSPAAIVKDGAKSPTAAGNLNLPVLELLVRPYPKLIAGTPTAWAYDATSDVFTFSYTPKRIGGGAFQRGVDTEIEVPALRYPTGYTVRASGARVLSAPDANLLRLAARPGASAVRLTVGSAHHHQLAPGPFTWPAGAKAIAPADCPAQSAPAIRIAGPKGARVVRAVVFVDGRRVLVRRARRIARLSLPPGLADGSAVRVVASAADGARTTIKFTLRGCRVRYARPTMR